MKKTILVAIVAFTVLTVLLAGYFIFWGDFVVFGGIFSRENATAISSILQGTVGSLLTVISTFLIIYSIVESNSTRTLTDIENNVVRMIDYHRENYREVVAENKDLFLESFVTITEFKKEIEFKIHHWEVKVELDEEELLDISYLFYFFGFRTVFDSKRFLFYQNRPKATLSKEQLDSISENASEPFLGIASQLSKYFRQLYSAIEYIDNQKIPIETKVRLAKMIRVQLSNEEQSLLFFNSISQVGHGWKMERKDKDDEKYTLIERYNMLRNISPENIGNINIKKYYPKLRLEHERD